MAAITKGPPSIEVPHLWNAAAYLNDIDNVTAHVKLDDIGVETETPDTIEANQLRRGSYAYPTSVKSATWSYDGRLRARTLADLRMLEGGLRSAFRDRQTVGTMLLLGDPTWFFQARVVDLSIPKGMIGGPRMVWPFQQKFDLTLRILDPRVYLLIPAASGPNAANASVVLENTGLIDTDPTFTLPGFAGGSLVGRNETLDVELDIRNLPAGNVEISFAARTVKVNGVDRTAKIHPDSTWWDENEQGLIVGAQSVRWTSAWSAVWFAGADAG